MLHDMKPTTKLDLWEALAAHAQTFETDKTDQKNLGRVDNSSSEGLRPATCSRDPEILLNTQHDCTETDRSGSREQVAGRRDLNCQHALMSHGAGVLFESLACKGLG